MKARKIRKVAVEQPGIAFEKAVAVVQAQLDPAGMVTHNEVLIDRLGQKRQFDVVVRGAFAGQKMLGVIECKDLGGKVGTPEVDAFVTKAQDINANFKILMSRRGFSKPALDKCKHYGIQALSLIPNDPANKAFFIGTRWEADVTRWAQIEISVHFAQEPVEPVNFNAKDVTIQGKTILDWFTNYLLDTQDEINGLGWVVSITVQFDNPQSVAVRDGVEHLCTAISFRAERVCDKLERLVGISGTGFFDWQTKQATFPPGAKIVTDAVPTDFTQWQPRTEQAIEPTGFLEFRLTARSQLERVVDAIGLDRL